MRNLTATALLSLLATASGNSSDAAAGRPTVQLAAGTVTGTIDPTTPSVRQFLGIPYAQPPLGALRFSPPQAPASPHGDVDATAMPPSCVQYLSSKAGFYTREVLEFNLRGLDVTGPVSEDCLTVSVWTPESARPGADLPVLIYVYGGGFQTGGVDVPYQLPPRWVERTRSHVVVVMNYRLGIFGFPSAAGLDAAGQNLGLLDQRLAVEWARDNIAAFGGDPRRMGLWGQSAGSMSVGAYAFVYAEDPIVNSFMMDSGTELSVAFTEPLHSNFTFVAGKVGCGGLQAGEELECMRKVPAADIATFLKEYADSGSQPAYSFWPVVDDKFVFGDYGKLYQEGKLAKIVCVLLTVGFVSVEQVLTNQLGLVAGHNRHQCAGRQPLCSLRPRQRRSRSRRRHPALSVLLSCIQDQPVSGTLQPTTRAPSRCTNHKRTDNRQDGFVPSQTNKTKPRKPSNRIQANAPTFRYEYFGNFTNVSPKPWMGAYHSGELPMLFGTHGDFRGDSTQLERDTSAAMQDAWLALVRDGAAGVEALGWPAFAGVDGGDVVQQFGNGVASKSGDAKGWEARC